MEEIGEEAEDKEGEEPGILKYINNPGEWVSLNQWSKYSNFKSKYGTLSLLCLIPVSFQINSRK